MHHDRTDPGYLWARNGQQAQGVLKHLDAVVAMNHTDSPTLDASTLHPWVWDAVAPFWTAGQHAVAVAVAVAVEQGAKSLTAFLQQKSDSTTTDRELVELTRNQRLVLSAPGFTGEQTTDTCGAAKADYTTSPWAPTLAYETS